LIRPGAAQDAGPEAVSAGPTCTVVCTRPQGTGRETSDAQSRLAVPGQCLARPAESEDPERIAIREALAFGQAVYGRRVALGLSVADLALRADIATDEVECIEEGGTEPTIALLRRLTAALDADVRLTPGHGPGSVGLETHAA
jgi:ribosome-binding protein aMBF1 (putative translation factor)